MRYSEWLRTEEGRKASGGRTLIEWMKAEAAGYSDGDLLEAATVPVWPYHKITPGEDSIEYVTRQREWAKIILRELSRRYRILLGADNRTPLGKCDAASVTMQDGTVWTVPKLLAENIENLKQSD